MSQEISVNQVHIHRLKEKLRVEDLIETGLTNIPDDIKDTKLPELRIKLVKTALAYKNE